MMDGVTSDLHRFKIKLEPRLDAKADILCLLC